MKDVSPFKFGFHAPPRRKLIQNQKLYIVDNNLALIFDGTYAHPERSTNSEYQRRSHSAQKKKTLWKQFTIVTINGYIVETCEPFSANLNIASMMEEILKDPEGL